MEERIQKFCRSIYTERFRNKGITLIALVITIILLLILAGITIMGLTESGLFKNAKIAKQKTRYAFAKEIIEIKLIEIQTDCISKSEEYNIVKIAEGMKLAEDITIEKYYNKGTGSIKDGVTENLTDLEGIVVSVDEYSEYKFLIGEKSQLKGVLEGEVTDTTSIEEFVNIEEFEEKTFGNKVATDNIEYSYEKKILGANKIQILIIIKDVENGLSKIEYPDGDILHCNGKNEVGIDYTIDCGVEYVFKITSNNGYIKEIKIYEEQEFKLSCGDYVQYTANNYSKWITVGVDEEGFFRIVSVGAPEVYQMVGTDYTDAFEKLDNHCNQTYVNSNLAISAESYCYRKNIQPYFNGNSVVLNGKISATSDEVRNMYPYSWYINNHTQLTSGVEVRDFDYGNVSYILINSSGLDSQSFIRPVVTLRKDLKIIGGDGSEESPYVLEAR